ncbi:MAG: adenylosuccinate synthase [Deltaproteobacteria bacterium]|nr:adenylosuccinate synthase [Deltaproteobacteria bacterium]
MSNLVVIGAQWGDEGKGKIVDRLAGQFDAVARYAGGSNAGHTLTVKGEKVVVHLLPSGVLHPTTRCFLGASMVVDPAALIAEVEAVGEVGVTLGGDRLCLDRRAHLVLPYHRELDTRRDVGASAIGTTRRGIGPAYEDKVARRGLRVADLEDESQLREKLKRVVEERINPALEYFGAPLVDLLQLFDQLVEQGARLRPWIGDVPGELWRMMGQGQRVLFEGAQGVLLDLEHGSYPYVTSSSTLPAGACLSLGVSPRSLGSVIGVAKAYCTRVGEGPFPTEAHGEPGEQLAQAGHEFGSTTGRPRRCGWLDLVALRHAVRVSGIDALALTKIDVLAGIEPLRVCVGYTLDGKEQTSPPATAEQWHRVEPRYVERPSIEALDVVKLRAVKTWNQLPASIRDFVSFIGAEVGVPVAFVSTGPGREDGVMTGAFEWGQ